MNIRTLSIGMCAATAFIATSVTASDLTMRMVDHDGQSVRYTYDDGEESFAGRTRAGRFTWESVGTNNRYQDAETFNTFCVEIVQPAYYNEDANYSFASVVEVPSPNAGLGGMVANQAAALESLIAQRWTQATTGSILEAAAFQLAAWEIVYEGADVNYGEYGSGAQMTGLSTQTGHFRTVNNQQASSLADSWLASLFNDGILGRAFGFTSASRQDQIAQAVVIPLPAPVALAGLGLLGVVAGRRRFARTLTK